MAEYILNSRQMGISILPPDVNQSEGIFTVEGKSIRYGMSAIKGIGKPVMEAIVQERNQGGPYTSLKDFAQRSAEKRSTSGPLKISSRQAPLTAWAAPESSS